MEQACSTCATLLAASPRFTAAEKPLPEDRQVECCGRWICGHCVFKNARFATYCPYCQVSSVASPLPPGLREPPSYTTASTTRSGRTVQPPPPPPPYTPRAVPIKRRQAQQQFKTFRAAPATASGSSSAGLEVEDEEKRALAEAEAQLEAEEEEEEDEEPAGEDILHFLDHEHDSVASLSLRYGVSATALRRANGITSDHLLVARRTVVVPGSHLPAGAVSLSPRPVEGEEEERRKGRIRRWMVACKVAEYDLAVLYLEQTGYDVDDAVENYFADEQWERENPMVGAGRNGKNKAPRRTGLQMRGMPR